MTLYDLLDLVWYAFTAFILMPIGLGVWNWKQLTSQERWLVSLLIALLFLDIIDTILRYSYVRNHFMDYFRTLVVLWGGAFFYRPIAKLGHWPIWIAGLLTLLIPIEVISWVGFNHINTLTLGISWLLLSIYAFRCLNLVFDEPEHNSLRKSLYLYFYLGFFVLGFFMSGTRFFENYFIETSLDLYYFSDTLAVMMSAFAYGLFATGLRQSRLKSAFIS